MGKLIANQNLTLTSNDKGSPNITILTTPSDKVLIQGGGIYYNQLEVLVTNAKGSNSIITDNNGTNVGIINSTSQEVTTNSFGVIRESDSVTFIVYGTTGGNPIFDTITVTVDSAGQSVTSCL